MHKIFILEADGLDESHLVAALETHRVDSLVDARANPSDELLDAERLDLVCEAAGFGYLDRAGDLRVRDGRPAGRAAFEGAIGGVVELATGGRVAVLADPDQVHPVAAALESHSVIVTRIRADGSLTAHEDRLEI